MIGEEKMPRNRLVPFLCYLVLVQSLLFAFFLVPRGHLTVDKGWTALAAPSTSNLTRYVELDVLTVICTNTAGGQVDANEIAKLRQEVAQAEEFYWRNSHLKLDLNISYLTIDRYLSIGEFWDASGEGEIYGLPIESIEQDLLNSGMVDNQYDGVVVFYGWGDNEYHVPYGSYTYGVDAAFLGNAGYTVTPLCWDPTTNDWYFVYGFHQQIDSMFGSSGLTEYPNPNLACEFGGDFGENHDFNAYILRTWPIEDWFKLIPPWGDIVEAEDNDQDGVPDDCPGLAITEAILGSNCSSRDSDSDGLSDLEEVMAGIYSGSDPLNRDTDGDGVIDGLDPYPIYPVNHIIKQKKFLIDGALESGWNLLTDHFNYATVEFSAPIYVNWNKEYLFLAFEIENRYTRPKHFKVYLDAANDGWFHGRDNYEIVLDSLDRVETAHIWDCSNETISEIGHPSWDDEANYPYDPIIAKSDIDLACNGSDAEGYRVEVAIPKNPRSGLTLEEGKIGLRIFIWDWSYWATLFEQYTFCDLLTELDKTSPTGSIVINDGATSTTSASVTLSLSATDDTSGVAQMRFSHDNITWTPWETYLASKAWTLTPGDGTKRVYVQFIDNAGMVSTFSDTIESRHTFFMLVIFSSVSGIGFVSVITTVMYKRRKGEGARLIKDGEKWYLEGDIAKAAEHYAKAFLIDMKSKSVTGANRLMERYSHLAKTLVFEAALGSNKRLLETVENTQSILRTNKLLQGTPYADQISQVDVLLQKARDNDLDFIIDAAVDEEAVQESLRQVLKRAPEMDVKDIAAQLGYTPEATREILSRSLDQDKIRGFLLLDGEKFISRDSLSSKLEEETRSRVTET